MYNYTLAKNVDIACCCNCYEKPPFSFQLEIKLEIYKPISQRQVYKP